MGKDREYSVMKEFFKQMYIEEHERERALRWQENQKQYKESLKEREL